MYKNFLHFKYYGIEDLDAGSMLLCESTDK
jgi:hypothetical protein